MASSAVFLSWVEARATTREAARARIAAQWPAERKLARAHYVIRTDGAFAETDRLVDELYRVLMADAFTA